MELTQSSASLLMVILIFFILLSWHAYLHYQKHGKQYLIIRSFLFLIGLIGLSVLFLKPVTTKTTPSKNVILTTTNSDLKKLLEARDESTPVVSSIHQILNSKASIDTIIIDGNGLNKQDLSLLDSFNLKFSPSQKALGFNALEIPYAKENEPWILSGNINQSQPQELELKLSDGKILNSTSDDKGDFSFQVISKSAGHFTYQLSVQYPDTLIFESLPVQIQPSQQWNLLALSSSPSFELNYLKNHWVKLGNGFTLKQKVSNERFKETFLNNPKIALDKIDGQVLNKFNFLLVDTKAWNEFKSPTQKLILNYVAAGRIGLLFIGMEKGDIVERISNLEIKSEQEVEVDNIKFSPVKMPKGFRKINSKKTTVAGIRKYGLGSIGLMTIPETYRFILADQNTTYQNIWARVFSELYIAPTDDVIFKNEKWNWANEEVQINIYSRKEINDNGYLNGKTIVPIEKTEEQTGLYSTTVSSNPGWNKLTLGNDKIIHRFYSHPSNSWNAMKQSYFHKINHSAANKERNIKGKVDRISRSIPFYWGLILSLIGFGSLWLHERIYA